MSGNINPIIVGLDIGTTKIVAIAGRKNKFGKLEILGFGKSESMGVKHGIVLNIEQCINSIESALKNCMENHPNLTIKDVYVGIAGQHIKSRQTQGDYVRPHVEELITKKDVDILISMQRKTFIPEGDEIIDVIPQEFIVDNLHTTLQPIGMNGVKLGANFHMVTGSKKDIKNIKRCVDEANLRVVDIVLQPLASAAAVMTEEDLESGVAIVDIGGGTTDMAVFYDNILHHTAVIPYAGTNITEDIRNGLEVLKVQAELMKVQFGCALPDEAQSNKYITIPGLRGMEAKQISLKNLSYIIHARMSEIFEYVLYELKSLKLENKLHGGIILTGGGAKLQNILQLCQFVTGLNTRLGLPNEHLAGENLEELSNPMYSTCIGLILRGYSDFENGKFSDEYTDYFKMNENGDLITKIDIENEIDEEDSENDQFETGGQQDIYDNKDFNDSIEKLNEQNKRKEEQKRKAEKARLYFDKVFSSLKNKFMRLFEDDPDNEQL